MKTDNNLGGDFPTLGASRQRHINMKVVIFLLMMVLLFGAMAFWIYSTYKKSQNSQPKPPKQEKVDIPDRRAILRQPEPQLADPNALPLVSEAGAGAPKKGGGSTGNTANPEESLASRRAGGSVLADTQGKDPIVADKDSKSSLEQLVSRRGNESGSVADSLGGLAVPKTGKGESLHGAVASASNGTTEVATPDSSGKEGASGNVTDGSALVESGKRRGVAFPVQVARKIPLSPKTSILQGTILHCLLNTRVLSDIEGMVVCSMPENILSSDASTVLIPKGSRVIGEYNSKAAQSFERVAIIWNRIITPNYEDVPLFSMGTDTLGSVGVAGFVDEKWRQRLANAFFFSLTSNVLKLGAIQYGPRLITKTVSPTGQVTYEEEVFDSAAVNLLREAPKPYITRALSIAPTIVINQGSKVSILVAKDLDFSTIITPKK